MAGGRAPDWPAALLASFRARVPGCGHSERPNRRRGQCSPLMTARRSAVVEDSTLICPPWVCAG